jgi:endonuclease-3
LRARAECASNAIFIIRAKATSFNSLFLCGMNPKNCRLLYERLKTADPFPKTELEYASVFQLLVAVILSAQATDTSVNKATRRLFQDAPTPEAMLSLGEEALREAIKTIGLYQNKAKHVIAACRLLLERHGGEPPCDRAALEALPGVGRKTANVILNTAFHQPVIAVDTHIFRVANRTGLAGGKTVREVEDGLMRVTPAEYRQNAHHWLILHGRYVCKAKKPDCKRCIISDLCAWTEKSIS